MSILYQFVFLLFIILISCIAITQFTKTTKLKKTGLAGVFSASLELTREGLIDILQKKNFSKLLIKERK